MKNNFQAEEKRFLEGVGSKIQTEVDSWVSEHQSEFFSNMPDGDLKKKFLMRLYQKHLREQEELDSKNVMIDFSVGEGEKLRSIEDDFIKRLFYCLLCQQKACWDSRGWIKLDFPACLRFGFDEKAAKKVRLEDFEKLVPYGFDMRVIGANKPLVCFSLPIIFGEMLCEFRCNDALAHFEEVCGNASNK